MMAPMNEPTLPCWTPSTTFPDGMEPSRLPVLKMSPSSGLTILPIKVLMSPAVATPITNATAISTKWPARPHDYLPDGALNIEEDRRLVSTTLLDYLEMVVGDRLDGLASLHGLDQFHAPRPSFQPVVRLLGAGEDRRL